MYSDFGSILRNARMRQGYDINTVARRLRIRPDVIQSIEMADFDRMPPRGYARNMISSYARLLGLDPSELTRQYLDELHTYQMNRAGGSAREGSGARDRSRRGGAPDARQRDARRGERGRNDRNRGERGYAEGADRRARRDSGMPREGERARRDGRSDRSRRGAGAGAAGASAGRGAAGRGGSSGLSIPADLRERLPFMGIAIVVIVLVIILLVLVFGPKGTDSQEVANMPVTGVESATVSSADLSESSSESDSSSSSSTAEPTSFTFSYEVADGTTVWIDCTVDGQSRLSQQVTGPTKQEFTVSKSVTFTSGATDGVTVKQDDDEVKLKSDGSGTYTTTLKFSSYLKSWRKAHNIDTGDSSSSSSGSSSSSTSDSSSTATDESSSTSEDESSSATATE